MFSDDLAFFLESPFPRTRARALVRLLASPTAESLAELRHHLASETSPALCQFLEAGLVQCGAEALRHASGSRGNGGGDRLDGLLQNDSDPAGQCLAIMAAIAEGRTDLGASLSDLRYRADVPSFVVSWSIPGMAVLLPPAEAAETLRELVWHPDPRIRASAVRSSAYLPAERRCSIAAPALDDDDPRVREAAASVLRRAGRGAALRTADELLASGGEDLVTAVVLLGAIGGPEALERVRKALTEEDASGALVNAVTETVARLVATGVEGALDLGDLVGEDRFGSAGIEALTLAEQDFPDVWGHTASQLESPVPSVRSMAALQLGRDRLESSRSLLQGRLEHEEDEGVRVHILSALRRCGDEPAEADVASLRSSGDPNVASAAASLAGEGDALDGTGEPIALALEVPQADFSHIEVERQAFELEGFNERDCRKRFQALVDAPPAEFLDIVARLLQSSLPLARTLSRRLFHQSTSQTSGDGGGSGEASLSSKLASPDSAVRRRALADVPRHVAERGKVSVCEDLMARLPDEDDPFIIASILSWAGTLGGPELGPSLVPFLQSAHPRVRANAVEALEALGDRGSREALVALLRDPDNRVRANTVVALHRHGKGTNVTPALQSLLESEDTSERASGLYALARLRAPEHIGLLVQLVLRESEPTLFLQACELLQQMEAHPWLPVLVARFLKLPQGLRREVLGRTIEKLRGLPVAPIAQAGEAYRDPSQDRWPFLHAALALGDSRTIVRLEAVNHLSRLAREGQVGLTTLLDRIAARDRSQAVRNAAAEGRREGLERWERRSSSSAASVLRRFLGNGSAASSADDLPLESPDPEDSDANLLWLGAVRRHPGERYAEGVRKLVSSGDELVRAEALDVMAALEREEALPLLMEHIGTAEDFATSSAFESLSHHAAEELLDELHARIDSAEADEMRGLVRLLTRLDSPGVLERLLGFVDTLEDGRALNDLAEGILDRADETLIPRLEEMASRSPEKAPLLVGLIVQLQAR